MENQSPDKSSNNNSANRLTFLTVDQLRKMKPSSDDQLLGNEMLSKGNVTVVAGAPGGGKSRLAVNLAISGVTQEPWMGIPVQRPFKTIVLQTENGVRRLHNDALEFPELDYGSSIMISRPPRFGLRFDDDEFVKDLRMAIERQGTDLVIIDPWSAVVSGYTIEAFNEAIRRVRSAIGYDAPSPAILIVTHTRKPKGASRTGRALAFEVMGTQALASHARCVSVLEAKTSDPMDTRVSFTCCKNNDGELPKPSLWHRRNGAFEPAEDEPEAIVGDGGSKDVAREQIIGFLNIECQPVKRSEISLRLQSQPGCGRTVVYARISQMIDEGVLVEDGDGLIALAADADCGTSGRN